MHVFDFADPNMLSFPTFWLDWQRINRSFLDRYVPDLKSFVIASLQDGYYVYLFLDEYFIPHRIPYNVFHILHDIVIFGHDDEASSFEVAGFDEQGRYRQTRVTYHQFLQATAYSQELPMSLQKPVMLLKSFPKQFCDFDVTQVTNLLISFLSGKKPSTFYDDPFPIADPVYGINVYQALQGYIQCGLEHRLELEARAFQMLIEHKQLMKQRLAYLQLQGYLRDAQDFLLTYAELEKSSLGMRNNLLKYHITRQERCLTKIQDQLILVKEKEQKVLSRIIEGLP